jgi:hypothetical protein
MKFSQQGSVLSLVSARETQASYFKIAFALSSQKEAWSRDLLLEEMYLGVVKRKPAVT